ncbi:MAG TPA: hypothetical protein VMQ73_01755 [Methylomirabilota bacterium]|nr:hypothetical protein [Methylomirabilota bacterium]
MQLARTDGRHTRTLLALVIGMGVLIVVGTVMVVATIANRVMGSAVPKAASPGFGSADVAVPAGCQVVETVPATDRLVLRLGTGERCNQVIIVDLATGRLLGRLNLVPAAQ